MSPSNPADFSPATWDYAGEIACIALFFWDWVITLDDEVELIWRQPSWRAGAFFLPLRYSSFALMCFATYTFTLRDESQSMCVIRSNVEVWIRVILMILIIILVQIILQLRVYIMYNRSRTLLRLNGAFFVFEIAVTVALLAIFSQRIQYLPLSSNCGECIIWPRELGYCYVVPLIFEAYLATLMVKRSWENRRLFDELEGQSLFYVLVRDSVVYFFLVSSALAASMLAFFIAPQRTAWTDTLVDSVGAIGGARLILSMRRAATRQTRSTTRQTISTAVVVGHFDSSAHGMSDATAVEAFELVATRRTSI